MRRMKWFSLQEFESRHLSYALSGNFHFNGIFCDIVNKFSFTRASSSYINLLYAIKNSFKVFGKKVFPLPRIIMIDDTMSAKLLSCNKTKAKEKQI